MTTTNNEGRTKRVGLLLLAMVVLTTCMASYAQSTLSSSAQLTLIGSPGSGWQTWSVTPISFNQPDLNDNGAPWWDLQWAAAGSYGNSS